MSLTLNLLDSNFQEPRRSKSQGQILSYEQALLKAGDSHLYQIRVSILVAVGMFISGIQVMSFPFIFKEPQVQCKSDDGQWYDCTSNVETCQSTMRAHPDTQNTVAVTYNLFCQREEYRIMAETAYMIASALGVVTFGSVADKYGKRFALIMTYFIACIACLFHPFAPSWGFFVLCLVLSGLGRNPFIYFGYQLLMEVSNEAFRARGVLIMGVSFALGAAFTGPMNSFVNYDWQNFYLLFLAIPCLVGVPLVYLWGDESPMSFFPKRDYAAAKMGLQKIAQVNNKELPEFTFEQEESSSTLLKEGNKGQNVQEYTFLDLFRFKSLRTAVLGGAYICFVTYFVFYGQMLALDAISTDPVTVSLLTSIVEAASCIASTQFLTKLPRRATLIWSFTFTAVAFLMFSLITTSIESSFFDLLGYLELCLGRFWVAMLMCTTYVYANELFPTVVRSRGSGFVNFFGRIGSVVPSTVIYLCKQAGINPTLLFGLFALSATWVSYYMKETKGEPLKHDIEEEVKKVGDIELELILSGRSVNVNV